MEEEVLKNYTLALMNNNQEEAAKTFYTIPEVADKLMEDNQEDNTGPKKKSKKSLLIQIIMC